MRLLFTSAVIATVSVASAVAPSDWRAEAERSIAEVKRVDREGAKGEAAAGAARRLADLPPAAIPLILRLSGDANPLAMNLLRASVESIADRARRSGEKLPAAELEKLVLETDQAPRARRLAYELLLSSDPQAEGRVIPGLLTDPSPELRRDAVAYHLAEADELKNAGQAEPAKAAYQKALAGAIHDDQVQKIVAALKEYGVEVDLQKHFGFLTDWKIVGPFDNRGMKGFEAVYPPEDAVDLGAKYDGQLGEVAWNPITTDDPYGVVDIAEQIENYKGSTMYLAGEFEAPAERQVELRLGTPNAWKLWVNGEFLFGREEYHRGEELDQYRIPATLRPGKNVILLKILQNEQTDEWAQSYKFRLRVSDPTGQAVLPTTTTASK